MTPATPLPIPLPAYDRRYAPRWNDLTRTSGTPPCGANLEKYCAAIVPGEGRLAACLKKKEKAISEHCQQAMKDIRRGAK